MHLLNRESHGESHQVWDLLSRNGPFSFLEGYKLWSLQHSQAVTMHTCEQQRFQGWERVQAQSQSAKELEERVWQFVLKDRNMMLQHIQSEGDKNWIKDGVYFSLTSHNTEYYTYEVRSQQHHANRIKQCVTDANLKVFKHLIFIADTATEFLIHMIIWTSEDSKSFFNFVSYNTCYWYVTTAPPTSNKRPEKEIHDYHSAVNRGVR